MRAPLTGESMPVGKIMDTLPEGISVGDRKNMVLNRHHSYLWKGKGCYYINRHEYRVWQDC